MTGTEKRPRGRPPSVNKVRVVLKLHRDKPGPGKYYYWSDRWMGMSRRFRDRNPICKRCGLPAEVAHHTSYRYINTRNEWRDLESLCTLCHNEVHGNFV
jgi:hypothetical protein